MTTPPTTALKTPSWTVSAAWILPVVGDPVRDGMLTLAGEQILAIEPRQGRVADVDFGQAVILPGLVNAHTHLDLTGLRGRTPPGPDFQDWLTRVIRHRRDNPPEQIAADVHEGIQASLRHGTTLLGDIAGQGRSWEQLTHAPIRSVVFYELLGLSEERARQALADLTAWLRMRNPGTACRLGLGPHAPYSVRASLIADSRNLAERGGLPWAIHLAETKAELELLSTHGGPFVPFLEELGVWDAQGLISGPEEVLALAKGKSPVVFVHCNYLAAPERLPANATVVYCPRTHAAFGHASHFFPTLLKRGVRVALGTDSLASNPDLDLLSEARFLHRNFPEIASSQLLRAATLSGAEALGWERETGSLEAGKSADFVVLPLQSSTGAADPYEAVLGSDSPVLAVFCRGHCIHGEGAGPPAAPSNASP
jgi:aminodeoxyfutalosine deaminase